MVTRRALLVLPVAAGLAGCRPPEPETGTSAGNGPSAPASPFKVALLTQGALSDNGWNSLAGKALEQIASELGAETAHAAATTAQAEEQLRGFARDGFRLIYAHGNEFKDAARTVAAEHPDCVLVVSSGDVEGPNLASLAFKLGEAAYLAGMVAAGLSKTGRGGQIGGQSFPPVKEAFELFEQGARTVRPEFRAPITYVGNWSDANAAKELALGMIRDGADVLFQNCDAAGEGVFAAAEETTDRRVLVIGSNANQNDLKPRVIAASAVIDVPRAFVSIARQVKEGSFRGGIIREDLASGNVYLAVNPAFENEIPAEVRAKVRTAEEEIKSGKLRLGS